MILLDTHILIWWLSDPSRLSKKAARALKGTKRIGLSCISLWEFAMLSSKGRIELDRPAIEWLQSAVSDPRIEVLNITPSIAVQSTRLGAGFHGDPADRLIVATAQTEGIPLVTADDKIRESKAVETIWD